MGVVITLDDIKAYTEVDYIINHMNPKYIEMVPKKLLNFFNDFKDPNYIVNVNPYMPLQNQGLQKYTLEILALLHFKYWCENADRKQELYNLMLNNETKLNKQIQENYDINFVFDDQEDNLDENYNEEKAVDASINEETILKATDTSTKKDLVSSKSIWQRIKDVFFSFFK